MEQPPTPATRDGSWGYQPFTPPSSQSAAPANASTGRTLSLPARRRSWWGRTRSRKRNSLSTQAEQETSVEWSPTSRVSDHGAAESRRSSCPLNQWSGGQWHRLVAVVNASGRAGTSLLHAPHQASHARIELDHFPSRNVPRRSVNLATTTQTHIQDVHESPSCRQRYPNKMWSVWL